MNGIDRPRYVPPLVGRPRPVEGGIVEFNRFINVIDLWIFPVVLTGFNHEDRHGGILGQTSSDSCASESSANDDVIKGLVDDGGCGGGDASRCEASGQAEPEEG